MFIYLFNPFIPVAAAISRAPQRVMCVRYCSGSRGSVGWLAAVSWPPVHFTSSRGIFDDRWTGGSTWALAFAAVLCYWLFLRCRCHYYFLTFMTKTYFLGQFWATEGCGILRDPYVCYMLYFMLCVRLYYDVKLFYQFYIISYLCHLWFIRQTQAAFV